MITYTPNTATINQDRSYYLTEDEALFLKVDSNVERGSREADILKKLNNKYIQKYKKSEVVGGKHHLYTEYFKSTTLENLNPSEEDITKIESQIFSAYSHMISKRIVHGDINISNVLYNGEDILLIDWETATMGDTISDLFGPPTVTNHCGITNTIRMLRERMQ